jgi:hypothetical protein
MGSGGSGWVKYSRKVEESSLAEPRGAQRKPWCNRPEAGVTGLLRLISIGGCVPETWTVGEGEKPSFQEKTRFQWRGRKPVSGEDMKTRMGKESWKMGEQTGLRIGRNRFSKGTKVGNDRIL